ncbi:MAG: hypothetical protein J6W03_00420 [Bacteroidaceae bacterium]|nr:hypothetical protein [Bacteroidaceae bacterium]
MKYIKPSIDISEAQAAQMIAESIKIVTDDGVTVDGSEAKTKENNAWDIWGEE